MPFALADRRRPVSGEQRKGIFLSQVLQAVVRTDALNELGLAAIARMPDLLRGYTQILRALAARPGQSRAPAAATAGKLTQSSHDDMPVVPCACGTDWRAGPRAARTSGKTFQRKTGCPIASSICQITVAVRSATTGPVVDRDKGAVPEQIGMRR